MVYPRSWTLYNSYLLDSSRFPTFMKLGRILINPPKCRNIWMRVYHAFTILQSSLIFVCICIHILHIFRSLMCTESLVTSSDTYIVFALKMRMSINKLWNYCVFLRCLISGYLASPSPTPVLLFHCMVMLKASYPLPVWLTFVYNCFRTMIPPLLRQDLTSWIIGKNTMAITMLVSIKLAK